MPSVGMRRTTRVFGVVKGIDGARVLRSGRRLMPDSDDYKVKKPLKSEKGWLPNLENKRNSHTGPRSNGHSPNTGRVKCANRSVGLERTADPMDVAEGICDQPELLKKESFNDQNREKMFGLVYSRKRKRQNLEDDKSRLEEKFGVGFFQDQRRRKSMDKTESLAVVESSDREAGFLRQDSMRCLVLALYVRAYTIKSDSCRSISFADMLFSVLSYLRMKRVSLLQLFRFLMSNPVSGVYRSHGIGLLPEFPINGSGICKIFGARQLIPLFSVEFSAVPLCFMYMHSSMLLRYRFAPPIYVYSPVNESVSGVGFSYEKDLRECKTLVFEAADNLGKKLLLHPSVRSSKLASRTAAHKNDVYSRSIQKRRSSLRSRRGRNSPLAGIDRPNGSLMSDLINRRKSGIPFSSVARSKLGRSMPSGSFNEASCDLVGLKQNSASSFCSANILVIESDRCCREDGASVVLEMSDIGEWVIAIKIGGLTRYIHRAQKFMRPSSSNRFTRNIVWTADSGWKLEFPRRQDWVTFKDMYRECFDRNVCLSPTIKAIPVPGVREVSGYCDYNIYTYHRPDSYITMKDDEVSRTLAKKSASYDMDDEDEEWLNKFNNEYFGANKLSEHLTPENFELLIDAYEKAYYCCPDGISDRKAAANFCSELGQKDVLEVVYGYWMKKRKQKRSALVRVFQVQQPRRASLVPRPALRKKRSFKRLGSQCGRGKKPSQLQVMAAELSAQEEQNAVQRAQELKASADKSLEWAILKRKRAQFLMENADLATYRATMALKMVEAAQYAESLDSAAACLLD